MILRADILLILLTTFHDPRSPRFSGKIPQKIDDDHDDNILFVITIFIIMRIMIMILLIMLILMMMNMMMMKLLAGMWRLAEE